MAFVVMGICIVVLGSDVAQAPARWIGISTKAFELAAIIAAGIAGSHIATSHHRAEDRRDPNRKLERAHGDDGDPADCGSDLDWDLD